MLLQKLRGTQAKLDSAGGESAAKLIGGVMESKEEGMWVFSCFSNLATATKHDSSTTIKRACSILSRSQYCDFRQKLFTHADFSRSNYCAYAKFDCQIHFFPLS